MPMQKSIIINAILMEGGPRCLDLTLALLSHLYSLWWFGPPHSQAFALACADIRQQISPSCVFWWQSLVLAIYAGIAHFPATGIARHSRADFNWAPSASLFTILR